MLRRAEWGTVALTVLLMMGVAMGWSPARRAAAAPPGCVAQIGFGVVCTGALGSAGEVDTYTFSGSANDVLLVRALRTTGSFTPVIQLRDPNNNPIGSCYDVNASRALFACTVSATGTFSLQAYDYHAASTGAYELFIQKLNAPAQAKPVSFGMLYSADLATTIEQDAYTFDALINDQIELRLLRLAGSFTPGLAVYDASGKQICYDTGDGLALINAGACTLPATGRYSVLIDDYYVGSTGTYQWTIQRLGRAGQAAALEFGKRYEGALSTRISANAYAFTVAQNDQILLRAKRNTGAMTMRMRVYDSAGNLVCDDTGGDRAAIEPCVLNAAGTYNLLIDDYYVASTGTYTLHTQRINNPGFVRVAQFGSTLSDGLDAPMAVDSYTFSAATNDVISLKMTRTSGAFTPHLRVFDAGGRSVCSDLGGVTAEIRSCTLEATGVYTILADDYYASGVGNYTFQLGCTSGSCVYRSYMPLISR